MIWTICGTLLSVLQLQPALAVVAAVALEVAAVALEVAAVAWVVAAAQEVTRVRQPETVSRPTLSSHC